MNWHLLNNAGVGLVGTKNACDRGASSKKGMLKSSSPVPAKIVGLTSMIQGNHLVCPEKCFVNYSHFTSSQSSRRPHAPGGSTGVALMGPGCESGRDSTARNHVNTSPLPIPASRPKICRTTPYARGPLLGRYRLALTGCSPRCCHIQQSSPVSLPIKRLHTLHLHADGENN